MIPSPSDNHYVHVHVHVCKIDMWGYFVCCSPHPNNYLCNPVIYCCIKTTSASCVLTAILLFPMILLLGNLDGTQRGWLGSAVCGASGGMPHRVQQAYSLPCCYLSVPPWDCFLPKCFVISQGLSTQPFSSRLAWTSYMWPRTPKSIKAGLFNTWTLRSLNRTISTFHWAGPDATGWGDDLCLSRESSSHRTRGDCGQCSLETSWHIVYHEVFLCCSVLSRSKTSRGWGDIFWYIVLFNQTTDCDHRMY